jgi:hypothetical protein
MVTAWQRGLVLVLATGNRFELIEHSPFAGTRSRHLKHIYQDVFLPEKNQNVLTKYN